MTSKKNFLAETQVYLISGDATLGAWQAWLANSLRILIEMAWLAYIPLFAVVILCANEGGALRMFTKKIRRFDIECVCAQDSEPARA